MQFKALFRLLRLIAVGLAASAAVAVSAEDSGVGFEVAGTGDMAPSHDLLEDEYDVPVITFGRAVDLAGNDIEPMRAGIGFASLPSGNPLPGGRLTSGFGMRYHPTLGGQRFHAGVDIAAPTGTPVRATSAGKVSRAGWSGGYGILVAIDHSGSLETRYAHLSAVAVRPGETVKAGQVVGYTGSTGRSTGPHLHYETRVGGRAANPASAW